MAQDIREYMNVDEGIRYLIWKQTPLEQSILSDTTPLRKKEDNSIEQLKSIDSKGVQIPTVMKEYIIVKKMLINNALPIAAGKESVYSHKLIIDKKVLYNMMLDL